MTANQGTRSATAKKYLDQTKVLRLLGKIISNGENLWNLTKNSTQILELSLIFRKLFCLLLPGSNDHSF